MMPARQPLRRLPSVAVLMAALVCLELLLAACSGDPADPSSGAPTPRHQTSHHEQRPPRSTEPAPTLEPELPLAHRVVVIDPGHQLGNSAFPAEVGAPVDAGGFTKACNTTGTATDAGYPEATFTWEVARVAQRLLRHLGARVLLTRSSNSASEWGPCVDERGRAGNPGQPGPTADLKISIHADGSYAEGAHGFHVIAPEAVAPWTTDIAESSLRLAEVVRDTLAAQGLEPSTYVGSDGIDIRGDLGTLNLADIPTVMVELGNMRDAGDAAVMTSTAGRRGYASALALAVERFVAR